LGKRDGTGRSDGPHGAEAALKAALFPLGRLTATPGALEILEIAGADPLELLARQQRGDWGDLDAHDRGENERSVRNGWRILSAYELAPLGSRRRVWIITESDRSSTCILLPSEY
jgi:hypothetical protein